jgi:hypothetical protein
MAASTAAFSSLGQPARRRGWSWGSSCKSSLARSSRWRSAATSIKRRLLYGIELHRTLYYPLKAEYPALVSDLHVQARVKATEALKSALSLRRKYQRGKIERKVSQPQSLACPPRYNLHTYRVDWQSQAVRLSLIGGRQTIRFRVPNMRRSMWAIPLTLPT